MRSSHSRLATTIIVGLFIAAACTSAATPAPVVTSTASPSIATTTPSSITTPSGTPTAAETEPVAVTRDVAFSGTQPVDVWAPTSTGPWPVLLVLHGTGGPGTKRRGYEALVERIAAGGVVVYNVEWPVDQFVEDAEIVACAIGFARSTAADYGGSPDRVTVLGDSAGASMAATVGLAAELLEPIEDCATRDASIVPDAIVGVAGDYDYGRTGIASYLKESDPAAWRIIDPYTNIGRNPDLAVYLLHGERDATNPVQTAIDFDQALRDAGYEVHLTILEGVDHSMPVSPSFDAFQVTVVMALEAARG